MKNIILWLEDRPETIADLIIYCRRQGYEVKLSPTVDLFKQHLEEYKNRFRLIIIDVMLFSVQDLESINIYNSFTEGGYEAGIVVIDRFLRPDSKKGSREYFDTPILIVSSRKKYKKEDDKLKSISNRGGSWIRYIEKGGMDFNNELNWIQEFEKEINELKTGRASK